MFEFTTTTIVAIAVLAVISAVMAIVGAIHGYNLPTEYDLEVERVANCIIGAIANAVLWPLFVVNRLVDDAFEAWEKRSTQSRA